MTDVLWVGFGDIGSRALPQLLEHGYTVTGARRSQPKGLRAPGFELAMGDARLNDSWRQWLASRPKNIVLTLTPSAFNEEAYRASYFQPVQILLLLLAEIADYQPAIYFISSTSVYGDANGAWVNESTQTKPDGFSGRTMLACESLLLQSSYPGAILRCSGIYGPGRMRLLESVRSNTALGRNEWTNRVHADDVARAILFILERTKTNPTMEVIAVTDSDPALHVDVVGWLIKQLGIVTDTPAGTRISTTTARGSKRISNEKLKSLGFTFTYPSYKDGYHALIKGL